MEKIKLLLEANKINYNHEKESFIGGAKELLFFKRHNDIVDFTLINRKSFTVSSTNNIFNLSFKVSLNKTDDNFSVRLNNFPFTIFKKYTLSNQELVKNNFIQKLIILNVNKIIKSKSKQKADVYFKFNSEREAYEIINDLLQAHPRLQLARASRS